MKRPTLLLVVGGALCAASPAFSQAAADVSGQLAAAHRALTARDYLSAFAVLKPLSDEGNAAAQELLADVYANGKGIPKSPTEAERLHRLAEVGRARGPNPELQVPFSDGRLGEGLQAYDGGDYLGAFAKLKPEADEGDPRAMVRLGDMYAGGLGIPRSTDEARRLYQGAERSPTASLSLASLARGRLAGLDSSPLVQSSPSPVSSKPNRQTSEAAPLPPQETASAPRKERAHINWRKVALGALVVVAVVAVAAAAANGGGGGGGGYTPVADFEWRWDQFRDQYGLLEWRCRGVQSGEFADNYRCAGQLQLDNTWPG